MRKWWVVAATALVLSLALVGGWLPGALDAGVDYCQSDPIIKIGNTTVNILVGIPRDKINQLSRPVDIAVIVPKGAPRQVLFVDQSQFQQRVYMVENPLSTWKPGGSNVMGVVALASTDSALFPVRVTLEDGGRKVVKDGKTNTPLRLSHTLND